MTLTGSSSLWRIQQPAPAEAAASSEVPPTYIAELEAIDPELVRNPETALNRGENICSDIEGGRTDQEIADNAKARFESSSVTVSPEQAAEIVDVVRRNLCP